MREGAKGKQELWTDLKGPFPDQIQQKTSCRTNPFRNSRKTPGPGSWTQVLWLDGQSLDIVVISALSAAGSTGRCGSCRPGTPGAASPCLPPRNHSATVSSSGSTSVSSVARILFRSFSHPRTGSRPGAEENRFSVVTAGRTEQLMCVSF